MTKISNLYSLTNYITSNTSGNIVISAPSSGYALDVTGTGRFTGALTGTSATFSSSVTATKAILNGSSATSGVAYLEVFGSTTASTNNGQIRVNDSVTTSKTLSIGVDGANNLAFLQSFQDGVAYRSLILNGLGGNVGIGTTSPNSGLHISSGATRGLRIDVNSGVAGFSMSPNGVFGIDEPGVGNGRFIINTNGNVGIGRTNPGYKLEVINSGAAQGTGLFGSDNGISNSVVVYAVSQDGFSSAGTSMVLGRNSSTTRSINAGGTINASGADYAEYMTKAIDDTILKGDIVGINSNGLLTNIFADAISFVIKSTDPSYVGGDTWANVDKIGKLDPNASQSEKDLYNAKIEAERAKVDRIAFSGQVPCNVLGASVGDYIIPINDNGKIKGQAVKNPTFEQYQISVGKVWKIMEDGRAWVAVKIG